MQRAFRTSGFLASVCGIYLWEMAAKAVFFCRNPLGDGINSLFFAHLLHLNGIDVDTYHNTLGALQAWVPHLPVYKYPEIDQIPHLLQRYDLFFVVWDAKTEFTTRFVEEAKRACPDRVKVFYYYPSKNVVNEPYYSDTYVDPSKRIAESYRIFCKERLGLPKEAKMIGWKIPEGLQFRKHIKRVVIHPTGSGAAYTNWPKEQFLKLGKYLEQKGFEPVYIPGFRDMQAWDIDGIKTIDFDSIDGLSRYLYESGFLIGSDSGPGHLASSLGIPTLTVCRRKLLADLWAPGFAYNITLTPSSWIPNMRFFRLRDRHWKKFITLGMVKRGFEKLLAHPDFSL